MRTTFTGLQIFELERMFETKKYLNSGERSLRLSNVEDRRHPEDSHVSCHKVEAANYNSVRLVTFVKSGCHSGFVCSEFLEEVDGVVRVNLGQRSLLPSEACTQLYFSATTIKSLLLVSRRIISISLAGARHGLPYMGLSTRVNCDLRPGSIVRN